jgi:Pyruvate/2-oxoacid:ferredoxin oxidoreductase delta subunit
VDAYYHLRQKLSTHALGAPEREEFDQILRMLFTPEEAELALHLGFRPQRLGTIADRAGRSEEEAGALCESMANKGLVYAYNAHGQMVYALLPSAPGLFEFPLMIGAIPGVDMERLGQLWVKFYENGWGHELHGSPTNMARVFPAEGSIASSVTVLPFEEAARYVENARYLSLANCPCRISKKACHNPVDVCLGFDYAAKYLIERKAAKAITKEEALAVLRRSEDAGLVHCASNTQEKIDYICNCCSCCCGILGAATRLKDTASRPHSNFYSTVKAEDCTACMACVDRCPMGAITVDEVAAVEAALCIGCGLCASACPTEAIALFRKEETVPPWDHSELLARVAAEKGRLEAFTANL